MLEVNRWTRIGLAVLFAFLCLTALEASARPLDPISPEELSARVAAFGYVPTRSRLPEAEPTNDGACIESRAIIEVQDPLTKTQAPVKLATFRPNVAQKVPVVLVVPTLEGVTVVEPKVAAQLCAAGFAAIIADVVDTSLPTTLPAAGHEDSHDRKAVLALRTVIDLASHNSRFDKDKIGIIGLSVGAIVTSMLAAVEPVRLKAVVITLAGGNLPFILSTSDQRKIVQLKEQRAEFLKLSTTEEYETWLRPTIKFDPLYFAPLVAKDRLMMITAKSDTKVPYSTQQELYEAYHRPLVSEYSGGHVETILALTYFYFDDVIRFFKAKFGEGEAFRPLVDTFH